MTEQELEKREKALRMAMKRILPEFVKSCTETNDPLLIHQDGFAADCDEYELLGMAIKFGCLCGKKLGLIGKNNGALASVNIRRLEMRT